MSDDKIKVCITGAGGFIAAHLGKKLKEQGKYVVAVDWKKQEFFKEEEFCDEFKLLDLRNLSNCVAATEGCQEVYNLAADMGGMGFIQSNHSVLFYNNTMISFNMVEAARRAGAKRFFYASSACVYNESKQEDEANPGLKEEDAWPAQPQDAYGLEKLASEELAMHYGRDFGFDVRIARFHNVYGPHGTWTGGREKAPAAFCRKALTSTEEFEIWGNGEQTRSFMYVDDCIEGILRLMDSDFLKPINLGSDEMVSMNQMADMVIELAGKTGQLKHKHVPGPEGVRGRNSDNTLIKKVLGWAPGIDLKSGLKLTMAWISDRIEEKRKEGASDADFQSSKVVTQSTESLDSLK
ncbi:GDP-mannose 3,5-epimerase 1 [Hondaea fermentalgiana]|uniref:GDP-mannose 3,5-epimerase 1 n=1 Tax=Hondaea fermentalgiana TaxID=2315210 RepID=A0A2R5GE56_9STRA|nr:GDP-mannose 3,5-epimerase 1 [Hondaea fermentalgiana]|eukprot:GBG29220.1 GDP-mannose 3,5-epimerase 1 [Hondaea fermentalgiana]